MSKEIKARKDVTMADLYPRLLGNFGKWIYSSVTHPNKTPNGVDPAIMGKLFGVETLYGAVMSVPERYGEVSTAMGLFYFLSGNEDLLSNFQNLERSEIQWSLQPDMGGFFSIPATDEEHKDMVRATHEFLSKKTVEEYMTPINDTVDAAIEVWKTKVQQGDFDFGKEMGKLYHQITLRTLFGNNFPIDIADKIIPFLPLSAQVRPKMMQNPNVGKWKGKNLKLYQEHSKLRGEIFGELTPFVQGLRSSGQESEYGVLASILNLNQTDEELIGEIIGLYGASVDTTKSAVETTIAYLASQPLNYDRVQKQSQKVFTELGDKPLNHDALMQLTLPFKSFMEAVRLAPALPALMQKAKNEFWVQGKKIPAGAFVFVDIYHANRDKKVFGEDANEYNMDRELQESKILSWWKGPGICKGIDLSQMEVPLTIAKITAAFDVTTKPGFQIDFDLGVTWSLTPDSLKGLKFSVKEVKKS